MLIRYELQKLIFKRANQIVVILLAVLIAYTCRNAIQKVEWVDDKGNAETGHAAAVKLREASEEWSGVLDQELLEKVLAELKEIYGSTQIDVQSQESNWILQNKLQGLQDLADILIATYGGKYDTFEEMVADLQPEDLLPFYEEHIENRKELLYEDETSWGYNNYSEDEKQYILSQYASLESPIEVGYHEGWVQASEQIPGLLKYGIILLSFVLAGIFSDEFSLKTDAIYYNTLHGRTKATAVKVGIGFLVITVAYWLSVGVYSIIVFASLGTDGANYCIQSHVSYWNIRESMTLLQKYLLTIGSGYLGYLLIGFLIMWISAKTKSPVLAVLIPSLLILLPDYLRGFYSPTTRRVIGLLPDKLLDIWQAVSYLYLYTIGGNIMTAAPILLTIYPCLTVFLVFLCYHEYRHKQIA